MPVGNRSFATEARISLAGRTILARALIPLMVVTLLLCHGAFGPADQLLPGGPDPVAGHLALAGPPADQGVPADSEGSSFYYAVALLLIVATLFWSRLARARMVVPTPITWGFGRPPWPACGRLRGPTVFALRVLRL